MWAIEYKAGNGRWVLLKHHIYQGGGIITWATEFKVIQFIKEANKLFERFPSARPREVEIKKVRK